MTPSSLLPIDWSQTNLRELVDFIGPRLGCNSADKSLVSKLVFYSLRLREWPGECIYFKHPNGINHIPFPLLEWGDECMSCLGDTFDQIISRCYEPQPPREKWTAFRPDNEANDNYRRSVAASNRAEFMVINRALDQFSVELIARRLSEATRANPSAGGLPRTPRL